MKKIVLSLLLAGFAMSAMAEHESVSDSLKNNAYVGAKIGVTHLNTDGLNDRNDATAGVVIGSKFNHNFGIEAGYNYLNNPSNEGAIHGLELLGTASYPVTDKVSVVGKAGAAALMFNGRHGNDNDWGTSFVFGGGAVYSYADDIDLVAEVKRYNHVVNSSDDITTATIGVNYKF